MHTLYRAWEGEVVITVGSGDEKRQFRSRRDLLVEQSGYIKSLLDASPSNEVSVPSVSPEIFASILNFINTGLLDLTPDNIYSILLATHLLHIPRAVELCRSYLVLERHRLITPPSTIIKPIPSRKYLPSLYWPPPPPPTYFPFSSYTLPFIPPMEPIPSTSLIEHQQQPIQQQNSLPCHTEISKEEPQPEQIIATSQHHPSSDHPSDSNPATTTKISPTEEKIIKGVLKDIACCDGPVRFKRVLNHNYGALSDTESLEGKPEEKKAPNSNRRVFICGFCKHSFKSHYCYRKHTRRHLNPVSTNSPVNITDTTKDMKDMNVQYYPCKTCGSKFPSYYFVHKHRKLCHGAENYLQDKTSINSQNEEPAQ